jgi:hypothetical protein
LQTEGGAAPPAQFVPMFNATLLPANYNAVAAGNTHGFTPAPPYLVYWAAGAHSTRPCARDINGELYALFESRFSTNRLNLGFNPDVRDEAFALAYAGLAGFLVPGALPVVQAKLDANSVAAQLAAMQGTVANLSTH